MSTVAVGVDDAPAFSLVFDTTDFLARRSTVVDAGVRLSVSAATLAHVAGGAVSGSAAAMEGLVTIDGDRSVLNGLAGCASGPRFRSHFARPARPAGSGPDLVAVLGAPNDADGQLSQVATDRCAAAVDACRRSPAAGLVLCGGSGAHFNTSGTPHWRHCEVWLARRPTSFRPWIAGCVESRHTYEDVLLLREVASSLRARSVTVVTSDFHAARARFLLDVVLPGTRLRPVSHDRLATGERQRLVAHEDEALARTVAATLLFGVDRLPAGVVSVPTSDRLIVRPPAR